MTARLPKHTPTLSVGDIVAGQMVTSIWVLKGHYQVRLQCLTCNTARQPSESEASKLPPFCKPCYRQYRKSCTDQMKRACTKFLYQRECNEDGVFLLSPREYSLLAVSPCDLCGYMPKGVDLNNVGQRRKGLGFRWDNCIPICDGCDKACHLPPKEFAELCQRVMCWQVDTRKLIEEPTLEHRWSRA